MSRLAQRWPDAAMLVRFLEPVHALAVAVLDDQGRLLDANHGFRRLVQAEDAPSAFDAGRFLALPTFETLHRTHATGSDGILYRGRITIDRPTGDAVTLVGEVRRRDRTYLLLAEHEIEQLEAVAASMLQLNEQMAESQRELVRAKKQLEARERELERMAATDPLTGLANRRDFDRRLNEAVARSQRTGRPLCVVMVDLDGFKIFNDRYGHHAGDACLETVARILATSTRPYDVVSRYGGEEFALVLVDTDAHEALARTESLREAIEAADIPGTDARITASFGVSEVRGDASDDALRAADDALYDAKQAGRNRVRTAGA